METGSVKWWIDAKGYGFIIPDDGGEDVFAHVSEMDGVKTLCEGQRVKYSLVQGVQGPCAWSIRLIGVAASTAPTKSGFDPYAPQRHKKGRKSHLAAAINKNIHDNPFMGVVWLIIFFVLFLGSIAMSFIK